MQYQPHNAESVYHLFVIVTQDRDRLMSHLQANNIFPGLHYPVPCHLQKAYSDLNYETGDFPNAEYLSQHCISLPMFPELTDEEVNRVIEVLNQYVG
jgi:dTDP-4-amino-4,6-dideoxygalactose transaminase